MEVIGEEIIIMLHFSHPRPQIFQVSHTDVFGPINGHNSLALENNALGCS